MAADKEVVQVQELDQVLAPEAVVAEVVQVQGQVREVQEMDRADQVVEVVAELAPVAVVVLAMALVPVLVLVVAVAMVRVRAMVRAAELVLDRAMDQAAATVRVQAMDRAEELDQDQVAVELAQDQAVEPARVQVVVELPAQIRANTHTSTTKRPDKWFSIRGGSYHAIASEQNRVIHQEAAAQEAVHQDQVGREAEVVAQDQVEQEAVHQDQRQRQRPTTPAIHRSSLSHIQISPEHTHTESTPIGSYHATVQKQTVPVPQVVPHQVDQRQVDQRQVAAEHQVQRPTAPHQAIPASHHGFSPPIQTSPTWLHSSGSETPTGSCHATVQMQTAPVHQEAVQVGTDTTDQEATTLSSPTRTPKESTTCRILPKHLYKLAKSCRVDFNRAAESITRLYPDGSIEVNTLHPSYPKNQARQQ